MSDLIKNEILQSNASAMAAQIDADRPEEYRGLTADQIAAKMAKTHCLLYTSPSPRDRTRSRMPSSA